MNFLQTSIEFLKGVGPQRAELLKKELGVFTFEDLLNHFPFRYIDRSTYFSIAEAKDVDTAVQLRGIITGIKEVGIGRKKKLSVKFEDRTGVIELVWFQGIKWILPTLKKGVEFQVYGKPKFYGNTWNIPHPEIVEFVNVKQEVGLQPVYSTTEKLSTKGLHSRGIEKLVKTLIEQLPTITETLPQTILQKFRLMDRKSAFIQVHQPMSEDAVVKARGRLKFEELFYLQMELLVRKQLSLQKSKGFIFEDVGALFNDFYAKGLPFELTGAQKRVLKEIRKDFLSGKHMNRLLQGDVGAGKTLVALFTALMGIGNAFQAAMIAPTEILATQHFETIRELLKDFPC